MSVSLRQQRTRFRYSLAMLGLGRPLLVGIGTALLFGLGGYLLVADGDGSMGAVLFLLLPVATGFAVAMVAERGRTAAASVLVGLVLCAAIMILTGVEGWVCLIMSTPLVVVGITIGCIAGHWFRRALPEGTRGQTFKVIALVLLPGLLVGAGHIEEPFRRTPRSQTVTNAIELNVPRSRVWAEIKRVDQLKATKHFLQRIGLPVPVRCTLEREGVGAGRTCYFESGKVEERITAWDPPRRMSMEVTDFDVPGRPWLSFRDASYVLTEIPGGCRIERSTTIVSRLSPAWYWSGLEKMGVEIEHKYLFEGLRNKIEGR